MRYGKKPDQIWGFKPRQCILLKIILLDGMHIACQMRAAITSSQLNQYQIGGHYTPMIRNELIGGGDSTASG
jgi:hypothetical protein